METRPFQFTGRIRSFGHAIAGIIRMVRCQHNAWIHLVATAMVIAAGFFFHLSPPGMVLDCTRGLDRLDGGGLKHGVRIFGRRGVTELSSCSARRQGCSCRRGADNCARVISDRRNHFLATCEGPVGPLTRSTHTEIFVMSSVYIIPTHLLLFSRQTNS
jgi:Prokaryotic diacylglycerol kinase